MKTKTTFESAEAWITARENKRKGKPMTDAQRLQRLKTRRDNARIECIRVITKNIRLNCPGCADPLGRALEMFRDNIEKGIV